MTDQRDTPRTDAGNDSGDLAHEAQREIDRERDQRDTPDTRTPSAEARCGHGLPLTHAHWDGYRPGHAGAWEPCDSPPGQGSDAPSAPNRAPTDEALTGQEREVIVGALDNFVGDYEKDPGVDPAYVAVARSARAKIATTEGTADRDALVERLRQKCVWSAECRQMREQAADALEDLTRENERLRAVGDVLAVELIYQVCAECGLPNPERYAVACESCLRRGSMLRRWRAALVTASEDRGDSQGAVRDG